MNIQELSIGDWVQDGNGIIAKVRGIENWDDGYILNVQTVSGSICTLLSTGALPIPLTPEILEKNGFVDNGVGQHYLKCGDGVTVRVGISPLFHYGCWLVATDKEADGTVNTTCVIFNAKHIHQLQRAIQLANVDKDIEL